MVHAIRHFDTNTLTVNTLQSEAEQFSNPVCLIIPKVEKGLVQSVTVEYNQAAAKLMGLKTTVEIVETTTYQALESNIIVIGTEGEGYKTRLAISLNGGTGTTKTRKEVESAVKSYTSSISPSNCAGIYQFAGFDSGQKLDITESWYFELQKIKGTVGNGEYFTFTALTKK